MKLAIISDIHDNQVNLEKCLDWCKKQSVQVLACCGDITNSETLKHISNNFSGAIYLIRGNMDIYDEIEISSCKNITYLGRFGSFELENKKIGICHEPDFIGDILRKDSCEIIFYGHTHKPWTEEKNGVKIINPGTLGGVFQKATFAFWDIKKDEPELKILELL